MFTTQTKLRELYQSPIGHDIIQTLLTQTGAPMWAVKNPLVGSMTLGGLQRLTHGKLDTALVDTLLHVLNTETQVPPPSPAAITRKWWKEAIVYQIYPRSFADANGDGIGDLAGVLQKLPYLKKLGVTVLWLSPIYDSPNDDGGYDIRDYQKILADFGTMKDFDALLEAAHKNGMRLIMDLVVNHTSDEHKWFKEACKSRDNPYHDYYIWADGKGDDGKQPPNNWISLFRGSAWNYYKKPAQFALHLFSKKQMDLNWDHAALRTEIYAMMRWWLDKGVDGFRMDVINFISKDGLGDASEALGKAVGIQGIEHYFYGPHLHEYLHEMRTEAFGRYDTFTVGETPGIGMELAKMLTAESRGELDTVFNFDHLDCPGKNRYTPYRYDLHYLKKYLLNWQQNYGNNVWMSLFFNNHDNPRMIGKINPDPAVRTVLAKLLATIQMTLKGTPFLYQGEELGIPNAVFHCADELRDVEALNLYQEHLQAGATESEAFERVKNGTRDHARTPMPWNAGKNAGFTKGTPWLKLTEGYAEWNAAVEMRDKNSVWAHYKALIVLRKKNEALIYGDFCPVFTKGRANADVLCYFRTLGSEKFYVECNLTAQEVRRPAPLTQRQTLLLSNYESAAAALRPYEANVYAVQA